MISTIYVGAKLLAKFKYEHEGLAVKPMVAVGA